MKYFDNIKYSTIALSSRDHYVTVKDDEGNEIDINEPIEGYSFSFSITVTGKKE